MPATVVNPGQPCAPTCPVYSASVMNRVTTPRLPLTCQKGRGQGRGHTAWATRPAIFGTCQHPSRLLCCRGSKTPRPGCCCTLSSWAASPGVPHQHARVACQLQVFDQHHLPTGDWGRACGHDDRPASGDAKPQARRHCGATLLQACHAGTRPERTAMGSGSSERGKPRSDTRAPCSKQVQQRSGQGWPSSGLANTGRNLMACARRCAHLRADLELAGLGGQAVPEELVAPQPLRVPAHGAPAGVQA